MASFQGCRMWGRVLHWFVLLSTATLSYIKESNKAKLFSQLALYYSVFGTVFLPLPPWKKESAWQRSRHLASDDKLLDSSAVRWAQVTMGQHCDTDTPTPAPLTRGGSDGSKLVIKFFTIPSERRWYRHRAGQCKLPDPPPICQILTQANNNFSGVVGPLRRVLTANLNILTLLLSLSEFNVGLNRENPVWNSSVVRRQWGHNANVPDGPHRGDTGAWSRGIQGLGHTGYCAAVILNNWDSNKLSVSTQEFGVINTFYFSNIFLPL